MLRSTMSAWTLVLVLLAFVWTGKAAECPQPVPEGNLMLTNEAILKNHFPDGSKITLECPIGYMVEHGSDTITCTDGTWSDPELICKKKDCGLPKPSPNLRYDMADGTLFGAYIRPVCDTGYYLQGSNRRQCLDIGWSGRSQCFLITCEKPTEIPNGMITVQSKKEYPEYADVIKYTCNFSYKLVGNQSITCQEDGEYSSAPPQCIYIECQAPEVQFGVQIKGESHYTYKSEAIFQCQPGYTMEGFPRIVCEEHGWSKHPVCIKDLSTINLQATEITSSTTFSEFLESDQQETEIPATTTSTSTSPTSPDLLKKMPDPHPTAEAKDSPDIAYGTAVFVGILSSVVAVFCILYIVHHYFKRIGSYDTGEASKTKEELLQKKSPNLTPV
ncbi:membrane cofactor protein isoform X2 [Salminus brasiliensis]|uniref:membrane cofactor protein isoform X2 n=1 Tax=Salminus brasiliensis TaxID=930266 RepID=UPI003B82E18A